MLLVGVGDVRCCLLCVLGLWVVACCRVSLVVVECCCMLLLRVWCLMSVV